MVGQAEKRKKDQRMTTTWFCPECFEEVGEGDSGCAACGAEVGEDQRTYEQKLIAALRHRLPDRQVLAAKILGLLRSEKAVPHLGRLARQLRDPYLGAEAVVALGHIRTAAALAILEQVASRGPAVARKAARRALAGTVRDNTLS
jgi:hypothetical protein